MTSFDAWKIRTSGVIPRNFPQARVEGRKNGRRESALEKDVIHEARPRSFFASGKYFFHFIK